MARLTGLALLAALTGGLVAPATAAEKFGDKRVYVVVKSEAIDDGDGHVLVVSESKGYDTTLGNTAISRSAFDLTRGAGPSRGYVTVTEPDGDKQTWRVEGQSKQPGPDGKPTNDGTWVLIGGTGKWAQRTAQGTYRAIFTAPGFFTVIWEGTWDPKK